MEIKSEKGFAALIRLFRDGVPATQQAFIFISGTNVNKKEVTEFLSSLQNKVTNEINHDQVVYSLRNIVDIEVVYFET